MIAATIANRDGSIGPPWLPPFTVTRSQRSEFASQTQPFSGVEPVLLRLRFHKTLAQAGNFAIEVLRPLGPRRQFAIQRGTPFVTLSELLSGFLVPCLVMRDVPFVIALQ